MMLKSLNVGGEESDFDQYLDDEDDNDDSGNDDVNIFNSRRNMLQKGKGYRGF